tara:strand:- start:296 stop:487 length:192 start_codon:yes stop_codon:yes gene_type:complete
MNTEKKVSSHEVLNGGTIELFSIECFFYVKSVVNGVVKFSEAVGKGKAEFFIFDAVHYGCLDF